MRIPYQHIEINSNQSPDEFEKALQKEVADEKGRYYWGRRFKKKFRGKVESGEINILPVVPYWNISPVRLKGRIESSGTGSVLKCKAYPTFLKILLVICTLISLALLYSYFQEKEVRYLWGILITWASAYAFTALPFYIELRKSLDRIRAVSEIN